MTIKELQEKLKPTWFDTDEVTPILLELSTRENGDVGEEEYGQEDIDEANRLIKIARDLGFKASGDVCDEWVYATIIKPTP